MIFENAAEVELVNKLLGVIGGYPRNESIMTIDEFNTVQDILRKASASFINRQDRDVTAELQS